VMDPMVEPTSSMSKSTPESSSATLAIITPGL
jgi:hypothetical protein